ncbi:hypothetical protein ACFRQM_07105 [Streptomyces sp. NPDC056831]|uniref:hypothetical protein n=1 Tax=Streptomyces sp. NPDC056831 TaxID=3345954 RepID=UPI0036BA3A12
MSSRKPPTTPPPAMLATPKHERDRMTERIQCLVRNSDAIGVYLGTVRATERPDPAPEAPPALS